MNNVNLMLKIDENGWPSFYVKVGDSYCYLKPVDKKESVYWAKYFKICEALGYKKDN